jgi:hypothetical protein
MKSSQETDLLHFSHESDLLVFLLYISLVDADRVDPDCKVRRVMLGTEADRGIVAVLRDSQPNTT